MLGLIFIAYWQPWLLCIAAGIVLASEALRLFFTRAREDSDG